MIFVFYLRTWILPILPLAPTDTERTILTSLCRRGEMGGLTYSRLQWSMGASQRRMGVSRSKFPQNNAHRGDHVVWVREEQDNGEARG